jgi:hypothetical protein
MSRVKIQNNAIIHNDGSADRTTMTFDYDTSAFPSEPVTEISANLIPTIDNAFQLGTGAKRWSHIFQTGGSVYMGNDGLLTVSKGKMVIRNRKDGNLFPPPLWHQKHALYKYGIQTSVQQDGISRKTRNYIGTIQYDEKVGTFTDASPDTLTIQDTSSSAESESDDFYKDWYIQTTGTVGGSGTIIYGKITGYTASSKTMTVANWFSDSSLSTGVTVTAVSTGTLFNVKSPAAYNSRTQTFLDGLQVSGSISTVTSQSQFILNASSGTLSTSNDTYNKIYSLKVVNGGNTYYAKVTNWTASTNTVEIASSTPWHTDISCNFAAVQPTIAVSDTFTLIARKVRLVDLNIEEMLNILETDVPNAQDYKKYNSFGDDLSALNTSFTIDAATPWDDYNVYDTEGNITSAYDTTTGTYKSGTAIDIYSGSYNQATGFASQTIGEGSTFRSVAISQASITSDAYNTLEVILPSNDANSLSPTTDYTGYEIQLKDTNGAIEYMTVASSTSVTVSSVNHVKITVSWPFYSKPTTSHTYILKGYVDAYQEMGGDTGYSSSNQSAGITSLNYQIKLESTAIAEDDYYNGYKITIDVYDASNYTTTSIYGTVTDYSGSTKIITISSSTYGSGNQWTTDGSQASVTPYTSGYDYYKLEKSAGAADYQSDYYTTGSIIYDPMKTFQDASYGNLSAATSAGMDTQLYKFMEHIQGDTDALNFDQFDASQAVAYNWSDYFFDNKSWYGSTNAMYTDEKVVVGTSTPPTGAIYCTLNVAGSMKSRALLSVPKNTSSNNVKKITKDYKDKGYIFSKGLYIGNQNLNSIALRSSNISLTDGGLVVKGTSSLQGGMSTGTLHLAGGSITDTTGAISFGNENLTTTGTMTSAQFNMNSDKNLKKDIEELKDEFDDILKLNPVKFKWKEDFSNNTNTQYGLIAQDVQEIYPELVDQDDKSNLTVNYIGFIPLMISHIQNLHKLIKNLYNIKH